MSSHSMNLCPECQAPLIPAGNRFHCTACGYEGLPKGVKPVSLAPISRLKLVPKNNCPECNGEMVPQMRSTICNRCGYSPAFVV